jgi:hypothetical protein
MTTMVASGTSPVLRTSSAWLNGRLSTGGSGEPGANAMSSDASGVCASAAATLASQPTTTSGTISSTRAVRRSEVRRSMLPLRPVMAVGRE